MDKNIGWGLRQIIGGLLSAGAIAVIVALLGWAQSQPWFLVLTASILTFCGVLWIWDRFEKREERKHSILSSCKDKEIENAIYNWIDRSIYTIQKQPETDYIYFAFDVTDPAKRPVTIVREKIQPNLIKLLSTVILSDKSEQNFLALKDTQQAHVIRKLRVEMSRFGIGYEGIGLPLKQVTLSEAISLNKPLDEMYLMQRVMFVRMGVAMLQELLQLEING